jgi:hypothetical protein
MREEVDTLGASVMAGTTSLSLSAGQTLGSIAPGAILQVDWECFFVTAAPTASSISVIPGYYNTTEAGHNAGAILTVNPRFPYQDMVNAINEDIDSLSAPTNGLYQVLEVTVACNPVLVGYDLTDINTGLSVSSSNLLEVFQVRTHDFGPAQRWPAFPFRSYKLDRVADTTVFPSGMALFLYDQSNYYPGQPIRIAYKAPFTTPLVNPSDNVLSVTGLQQEAHDIPVLGAACRLMEFREFKRSFTEDQPQPRTATEVPVGSSLEAMKSVAAHRELRIAEERSRINMMYAQQYGR